MRLRRGWGGGGGLMWPPAPPPAPCSLPAPPQAEPFGACGRAAAVSAWVGPGGGVPGVGGRGGTVEGGGRTPRGPSPPPVPPREWAGLPGRGPAGTGSGSPQRGPRPAGRRSGGRPRRRPRPHGEQDAIADPAAPPGFHPPRPPPTRWWLGWHAKVAPPHPPLGGAGGRGGAPPPPPRGEAGRVRAEGWRRGGAGAATAGGGGVAHLNEPAWCGSGRGFSLSLSRGDAVGGGVLVGQSVKKKMSSSPRGNGQRGARR